MTTDYLTVREVAERFRRHEVTVRISLNDGSLHGRQRSPGAHWRIEPDCADAWNKGEKCDHYEATVKLKRGA